VESGWYRSREPLKDVVFYLKGTMKELPKTYEPRESEDRVYSKWEKSGLTKPKYVKGKEPFVVAIPPPNVTGSLHMGHALNNTIQDVMVRWHRMKGDPTLWIPGTDHAGIATQNVVEKKLAKEGKSRYDLGREKFIAETWKWKDKYEQRILGQLKTMGCSCDFSRTRFTMDEAYSEAVLKSFNHYYKKGYLYRDYRITNWCPRCKTSLSDLEVEHEDRKDKLWYIEYPIEEEKETLVVATTRPETMLGDTAVAVNPQDKRYKHLIGKTVILPLCGRKIPIVADEAVEPKFGTGAVKVPPAHDPTDFEIAERHNLEKIIVIDEDAKMTKEAGGDFVGIDRYKAREKVIELLRKDGWLRKEDPYAHSVGHCYRCHTVIEPLLSLQWFVSMAKLAKPAIEAVKKGKIRFHPKKWEKVYLHWMENTRDWCVSRQIWWGHQIPAWYCECGETIVSEVEPKKCSKCGSTKLKRDPDVLDTWFSSALWPFATLGWPQKTDDIKKYYPTSLNSTARDIIYLWVARMIMSGYEFTGMKPFSDVYIHATVFNHEGKRMSKSLGTGVDPLELIEKYGADAVRFGLLWQAAQGQDMKFSEDALLAAKKFANKVWNASRFVMMNLEGYKNVPRGTFDKLATKDDKKIMADFENTTKKLDKYLEKYDFQHAEELIYEFFWHNFCDKYIEIAKNRIREGSKDKIAAQYALYSVLSGSLKLLHPFLPFVTETIWDNLGEKELLIGSKWPKY
jgi:valyl-tRNA synthetase